MTFRRQLSKKYVAFNIIWLLAGIGLLILDGMKFYFFPWVIYPFGFFLLDGIFGKYVLNDEQFILHQVFSKTNIDYSNVKKVEVRNQNWFIRFLRGITKNTLVVHYNKYDEVFVNPVNEEEFIHALKEKAPQTEVVYP